MNIIRRSEESLTNHRLSPLISFTGIGQLGRLISALLSEQLFSGRKKSSKSWPLPVRWIHLHIGVSM